MLRSVLVTGGAGFIGSNLVEELLSRGFSRVRVLDDLSTGTLANLEHCLGEIEFVRGDVRDRETCLRACEGVAVVFHQAALPSVPRSIADPLLSHAVNADGTLQMLVAARDQGVSRFVFASSSSVYGNTEVSPKHEGLTPNPLSPYAIQKQTGEQYCRVFAALYGMETVALRYFNVFGPRQRPDSAYAAVVPRFLAAARRGDPVTIHGDGEQSRDFTYVANVVQANLLAAAAPGVAGQVFNVGCGASHSLADLCRGIEAATGRELTVRHGPSREGDVRHSRADLTRARRYLDYEPVVPFAEGLCYLACWLEKEVAGARKEDGRTPHCAPAKHGIAT
jgi:nucleoside-diphosphate-sugar epimerase